MSDYANAWEVLAKTIGAANGEASGSLADIEHLSTDQRIEVAKVVALLSISQELNGLREGDGNFAKMVDVHLASIAQTAKRARQQSML